MQAGGMEQNGSAAKVLMRGGEHRACDVIKAPEEPWDSTGACRLWRL